MAAPIINLRRAAVCTDCGTALPVGSPARWYRNGSTFGVGCHPDRRQPRDQEQVAERNRVTLERLQRQATRLGLTLSPAQD